MASWSKAHVEKLTVVQLIYEFHVYYGPRKFITVFTKETNSLHAPAYSDSTLISTTISVKQRMNIGAEFVCLNSRRWFMLCVVYISYLVLVPVWRRGRTPPP
jgi:hypothetical protein